MQVVGRRNRIKIKVGKVFMLRDFPRFKKIIALHHFNNKGPAKPESCAAADGY